MSKDDRAAFIRVNVINPSTGEEHSYPVPADKVEGFTDFHKAAGNQTKVIGSEK